MYWCTCTGTCTSVHVPVHVLIYWSVPLNGNTIKTCSTKKSQPSLFLWRHPDSIHVPVHVLMYTYLYMYWCTRICTCTDVHVSVHVLMYMYLYMYWCTRTCTCTDVHVHVHVQMYTYMCRTWKFTWSGKNRVLGCGHEKVSLQNVTLR